MTALASYLAARTEQGQWLLRIDDLDTHRIDPKAEVQILRQLESHGLLWDEAPRRQSEHLQKYQEALDRLISYGQVYACDCSRADLAQRSLPGLDGAIYDGRCRNLHLAPDHRTLRLKMPDQDLQFQDLGQGLQQRRLELDIGDFLLRRRDGIFAYQLACAVDEHAQGITEVVRGADLLGSTFMQLHLMQQLELRPPRYHHIAILTDSSQRKLSKQNRAQAASVEEAPANLMRCLELMGQLPPPALLKASCDEILAWAKGHWNRSKLAPTHQIELRSL